MTALSVNKVTTKRGGGFPRDRSVCSLLTSSSYSHQILPHQPSRPHIIPLLNSPRLVMTSRSVLENGPVWSGEYPGECSQHSIVHCPLGSGTRTDRDGVCRVVPGRGECVSCGRTLTCNYSELPCC